MNVHLLVNGNDANNTSVLAHSNNPTNNPIPNILHNTPNSIISNHEMGHSSRSALSVQNLITSQNDQREWYLQRTQPVPPHTSNIYTPAHRHEVLTPHSASHLEHQQSLRHNNVNMQRNHYPYTPESSYSQGLVAYPFGRQLAPQAPIPNVSVQQQNPASRMHMIPPVPQQHHHHQHNHNNDHALSFSNRNPAVASPVVYAIPYASGNSMLEQQNYGYNQQPHHQVRKF
jgi:hypothetical protein